MKDNQELLFTYVTTKIQKRNNPAIGRSWEELEKELFSPEEIAESELQVALISEIVKARQERGLSQKQLEELSGVKQPVIARLEKGSTIPQINTLLKMLLPLGKTPAIVPMKINESQQVS